MSEKEDKEAPLTQHPTQKQAAPPPATTGPSPIPSPVGRGVITEIPLSPCCSLLTVLFAVVSYVLLHTLFPYLYILKAQLSMFILSFFVILSFCLNTLKTLLNFFFLSCFVILSFCLNTLKTLLNMFFLSFYVFMSLCL